MSVGRSGWTRADKIAAGSLVATLLGVPAGYLALRSDGSETPPSRPDASPTLQDTKAAAAEQVRRCMTQHRLPKAKVTTVTPAPTYKEEEGALVHAQVFKSCTWPPAVGADADGYLEITNKLVVAFPFTSEAEGIGLADRITAPCKRLRLHYTYAFQGYQERDPPILVDTGQIIVKNTGEVWGPGRQLPFYFGPDEAVVLRNTKVTLDAVHCVEETQ